MRGEGGSDRGQYYPLTRMDWNGFEKLKAYVGERILEFSTIHPERAARLVLLAGDIRDRLISKGCARLIFICTHNSRRSHLGHLWGQLSASFYQVDGIDCYSGGTEATAFNHRAVKAMADAGMQLSKLDDSSNPLYQVSFSSQMKPIGAFSKKITDPPNPREGFIAVMTCSDADEACPVVHGAVSRFAIPYVDPKASDGTSEEPFIYAERCRQVSREMLYLFSRV